MPLTVGGGIKSEEAMHELLQSGADKISLNSAAINDPELITDGAKRFGSQCIVCAIDVKKTSERDGIRSIQRAELKIPDLMP